MRLTLDEVYEMIHSDPMFRIRQSFWRRIIFIFG